jgi:arsenite-transporting ATPase
VNDNTTTGESPRPGPRILLFTGKGGVGKTTMASATALRAAELGHRVIVLSADPAHSLGDALSCKLGAEPIEIAPNLHAQEINVYYSIQKYWGTLRQYVVQQFRWQHVDDVLAEEMAALPGMEEGATFLWVEKYYREREFDLVIIDSAPTGETLKLLALPVIGQWWMERVFPLSKGLARAMSPLVRMLTRRPPGEQEQVHAEAQDLYATLLSIHSVLSDPEVASIRLVVNPEHMVMQESLRAYTSLNLFGYATDAVIVNRVLPHESAGPLFEEYLPIQEKYLREIKEAFAGLEVFVVPHLGKEALGLDALRTLGRELYGEQDPATLFSRERPYRLTAEDGAYLLEIYLPFLQAEDVTVLQYGDELVVEVGGQRRNFFLPKFLGYYSTTGAKLEGGWLRVRFEKTTTKGPETAEVR